MAMRPHFAASLLALGLMLGTGCSTTSPSATPSDTTQNTPQPAQTQVAITEEKPAEPTPAAKPENQPIKRPEVAKITKDPFVNPFTSQPERGPVVTGNSDQKKVVNEGSGPKTNDRANQQVASKDVDVPEPDIEVRGLVRGSTGMMAILSSEDRTSIVRDGQMVDKYRVDIDNRGVTLSRDGHKFRVKIKNEFGI